MLLLQLIPSISNNVSHLSLSYLLNIRGCSLSYDAQPTPSSSLSWLLCLALLLVAYRAAYKLRRSFDVCDRKRKGARVSIRPTNRAGDRAKNWVCCMIVYTSHVRIVVRTFHSLFTLPEFTPLQTRGE